MVADLENPDATILQFDPSFPVETIKPSTSKSATAQAGTFLASILSEGPVWSKEVKDEATAAGVSWAAVRRAKDSLGVKVERRAEDGCGIGHDGRWYWSLPAQRVTYPS
jgi:putative DNA primase/helicase